MRLLQDHETEISEEKLKGFYVVATNFCARQIIHGQLAYRKHLFDLHQLLDQKGLILEQGNMPISKLKNMTTIACQIRNFSVATNYVEKYRKTIPDVYRDSACHFCYGLIAFYQNDYKEAIHHFIRVDKISLVYEINCRVMLLKAHYEMDQEYDERTMRIFRSADKFIKSQGALSVAYKKSFKHFTTILILLYRFRHRVGKRTLTAIQDKLNQFDVVSDKAWLAEKIKQVEGRKTFY